MADLKELLLMELVKIGPSLVEAGIGALVDKLVHHASTPSTPPPPVAGNPPPELPPLPPAFQKFMQSIGEAPKEPMPTSGSPVATGLALTIAEMYSPWFKPSADSDDERADQAMKDRILSGTAPLPPNCLLYPGVEPTPPNLDSFGDPVIPIPLTIHYSVAGPGLQGDAEFTPIPGHSGPYETPLGKMKPGRFDASNGYTGILVTFAPGGNGPSKAKLWATGKLPDGTPLTSNVIDIPWVAGH